LLFVDNTDELNPIIKMLNIVKEKCPENIYKIVKCDETKSKIKCMDIIGVNITIKIKKLPSLFMVNGKTGVEIPLDKIDNVEKLIKMLK
jgi:hypothetical protein